LALLIGLATILLGVGLGAMNFDPEMGGYIAVVQKMMEEKGQPLPAEAMGMMKMSYMIVSFCLATIAVPFSAAVLCLSTLPWLGWLGRRLLAKGRPAFFLTLGLIFFFVGSINGLVPAPEFAGGGLPTAQRMLLGALASVAFLPISAWFLLRTRSAVIPAIAAATWNGVLGLATFYGTDVNYFISAPTGLLVSGVAFFAGIALWIWKDPGGDDMAIGVREPLDAPLPEREAVAAAEQS
jgi:hypothetical protein